MGLPHSRAGAQRLILPSCSRTVFDLDHELKLLWFRLVFISFVLFSLMDQSSGSCGGASTSAKAAAMNSRRDLPGPRASSAIARRRRTGAVLESRQRPSRVRQRCCSVSMPSLSMPPAKIHALISQERRRQRPHLFNVVSGLYAPNAGRTALRREDRLSAALVCDLSAVVSRARSRSRTHDCTSIYKDLSVVQGATSAGTASGATSTLSNPCRDREHSASSGSKASRRSRAAARTYGRAAAGRSRHLHSTQAAGAAPRQAAP